MKRQKKQRITFFHLRKSEDEFLVRLNTLKTFQIRDTGLIRYIDINYEAKFYAASLRFHLQIFLCSISL